MLMTEIPKIDRQHGLHPISVSDSDALNIVFIHGLDGDAFTSWMSNPDDIATFWPLWLAKDCPDAGVWTLGYPANSTNWKAQSMPLADQGVQLLDRLATHRLGERPLLFVSHSMGGIIAKQLLRHANDLGVPRWQKIATQTRGIAFIATPHSGANLANFATFASAIYRTSDNQRGGLPCV
jgi:pimeloyl-ACP methyl ester carboxylesterase